LLFAYLEKGENPPFRPESILDELKSLSPYLKVYHPPKSCQEEKKKRDGIGGGKKIKEVPKIAGGNREMR